MVFITVGWSFPGLPMTIQKKEIHFAEKLPTKLRCKMLKNIYNTLKSLDVITN